MDSPPGNFLVIDGIYCDNIHAIVPDYFALELNDTIMDWLEGVTRTSRELNSKDASFEFAVFGFSIPTFWCLSEDHPRYPVYGQERVMKRYADKLERHKLPVEKCVIKVYKNANIEFTCTHIPTQSTYTTPAVGYRSIVELLQHARY